MDSGTSARRFVGLLDGAARFAADLPVAGVLQLVFVRSPHAHAEIVSIDTTDAARMPGVVAVFTAADLSLVPVWEIHSIPEVLGQPPLAVDMVRYVGERVVAIVASTFAEALDAAEHVVVTYAPRPALVDARDALDRRVASVHASLESNIALVWTTVPEHAPPADSIVVSGEIHMPRVAVAPMEPLSIVVIPGPGDTLVIHPATQSPHGTRVQVARSLRMPYTQLHVVVPNVGGGFGGKAVGGIVDYVVCAAVARELQRPVRFVEQRGDNLVTMHGRGMRMRYSAHADTDGVVHTIDVHQIADSGAYPVTNAVEPGKTQLMSCGPYRIGNVRFHGSSVITNLAPSGAYRGPGRSEASAVLEDAMDSIARRLHLDPVEVRRRNLLVPADAPYASPTGTRYDGTDFSAMLERALDLADYQGLRAEQRARRAAEDRTQLGIGVASIIDSSAWFARDETLRVSINAQGRVQVHAITASAGQDHAPAYATIISAVLPVSIDDIDVIEGDSDGFDAGFGSSGSRTIQLAGSAIHLACHTLLDRLRAIAAHLLEAATADIETSDQGFYVSGVPAHALTLRDLARVAFARDALPDELDASLDAPCTFTQDHATYPCMVCVVTVEVDTETGGTRVRSHHSVADCGRVIDPPNAEGQVIGANAQAIGQVLFEELSYDADGNPQNASLAEYLVPSAVEQPSTHEVEFTDIPAAANPLGAKGVGELGMVGTPAALRSAIIDALAPYSVTSIDLPCTPERIWRAVSGR
jgi:carbon-monoxide dehydrogenase large subunit